MPRVEFIYALGYENLDQSLPPRDLEYFRFTAVLSKYLPERNVEYYEISHTVLFPSFAQNLFFRSYMFLLRIANIYMEL